LNRLAKEVLNGLEAYDWPFPIFIYLQEEAPFLVRQHDDFAQAAQRGLLEEARPDGVLKGQKPWVVSVEQGEDCIKPRKKPPRQPLRQGFVPVQAQFVGDVVAHAGPLFYAQADRGREPEGFEFADGVPLILVKVRKGGWRNRGERVR